MTLTEFYAAVGGSYEDASARLQNDAFIGRFLRMLPCDDSMARLTAAVDSGSAGEAFRAVHTLKGIALNLSLVRLAEACAAMTEALRGSDTLPADPELYAAVRREYGKVRDALEQLEV